MRFWKDEKKTNKALILSLILSLLYVTQSVEVIFYVEWENNLAGRSFWVSHLLTMDNISKGVVYLLIYIKEAVIFTVVKENTEERD